jgi:hypothetical protein
MTAALEGIEWSAARPGRTLPPGKTRHPFYRRLGGPHGRSGREENFVPTGIRSRTVQPIAQSVYRLSYLVLYRDNLDSKITGTNTSLNSDFLTRVIVTYLRKTLQYGIGYEVLTSEYWRFNELYKFVYLRQEFDCHLQVCAVLILRFHMTNLTFKCPCILINSYNKTN